MGVTLDVPYAVLDRCRNEWEATGDALEGGWRRLERADVDGLSPAATAAVDAFRDTWVDTVRSLAGTARGHGDDIVLFRASLVLTDVERAEEVRALLPWVWRAAPIEGAGR